MCMEKKEYCDESIKIDFEIPEFLQETIDELIKARKENKYWDLEEETLISDINRAWYSRDITEDQAWTLRKKYLWWSRG